MKQWFENKSVAVVGNATSLFSKKYGSEIDSHDVIVRINKAAMLYERFDAEKSHGKRTDIWMFWRTAEYKKHFDKIDKKIKKMHMGHQDRKSINMTLIDFVYPDRMYDLLRPKAGEHQNPTTGLLALDYVYNCSPKSISVYGFDWKETPTFTDPLGKKEKLCPHDYETEKKYCREMFFSQSNIALRS